MNVKSKTTWWGGTTLTVAALGMVFGDIGTSPLYTLGLLFAPTGPHILPSEDNILGVLSLIFWLITVVVTIKYAFFVLRADNQGEGGIIALLTLVREKLSKQRNIFVITLLGLGGASLFLGDAVITPAISVLSAVEGAEVASPSLGTIVVPLVIAIIVALFAVQRFGTARISYLFGPIMLLWFSVLAITGIVQIVKTPVVLKALNPWYAINFIGHNVGIFLVTLSLVLLAITGAEALYSDLGHFGRPSILRAWLIITFPALICNYFGQGGIMLSSSEQPDNLFFTLVPSQLVIPLTLLATVATIVASQAVISGAFSLSSQATKLGFLPRIRVRYPSGTFGQVYVSFINWALCIAVCVVVLIFTSSARLADAYGLSVVGCMLITTILFFTLAKATHRPLLFVLVGGVFFGAIDVSLLIACLPKFFHGGWIAIFIAGTIFASLWVWHVGKSFTTKARVSREGSLPKFIKYVNTERIQRLPTTAVYLHPDAITVPLSMRSTVESFKVLHSHAILVSIITEDVPHVDLDGGIVVDDLAYDDGIWFVQINYGFNDRVNVPLALQRAVDLFPQILEEADLDEATYYVSRFDIGYAKIPGLPGALGKFYKFLKNMSADPVKFYKLPLDRTISMAAHIT